MKKSVLYLFSSIAICGGIYADQHQTQLIAGWDFSQYALSGANSVDGATFTGSISANYSDFFSPSPDVGASAYGTLYYDGSFSSTATNYDSFTSPVVAPTTGDLSSAKNQTLDLYPLSDSSSYNLLKASGQMFAQPFSLRTISGVSFVFNANAGKQGSDWQIQFAAVDERDGATIQWEVSDDGISYTGAGSTTISTSEAGYVQNFPLLDGASAAYIRATITDLGDSTLKLDNVGIHANLSAVIEVSWWLNSTRISEWRDTSTGYPGEVGIGFIHDTEWPWIFISSLGDSHSGAWLRVITSGDRSGFYAYNMSGGYWIYGLADIGWYYSFEAENAGWKQFH